MAGEVWALPCAVVQVVDGDAELITTSALTCAAPRALACWVNTAEVFGVDPRTAKAAEGHKQAEWVREWVAAGAAAYKGSWPFLATCEGFDKYGRDLVRLERRNVGRSLQPQSWLIRFCAHGVIGWQRADVSTWRRVPQAAALGGGVASTISLRVMCGRCGPRLLVFERRKALHPIRTAVVECPAGLPPI